VPDASGPILRLQGVRKSFRIGTPAETEVLHGVDLTLQRGEYSALIGPSGSGKSTLLNIIGLLDTPTSGQVEVDGVDTGQASDARLTRLRGRVIGFVFQHHHLLPAFTALENVMMPMMVAEGRETAAMQDRPGELLERVGLTKWRHQKTGQLSGGQQQRVAIARALAMRPALVLADEPTGNLDTASAEEAFALMQEVNRDLGTTFLIITHNADLARRAGRVLQVVDGQLV
jgi:lipoprotein-releasing system ATP-binding protein